MATRISTTPTLKGKDFSRLVSELYKNDDSPKNTAELKRLKSVYERFERKGISLQKRIKE